MFKILEHLPYLFQQIIFCKIFMENLRIDLISEIEEHVAGVLTGPIEHPFRRIIRCTKLVLWLSFNVSVKTF